MGVIKTTTPIWTIRSIIDPYRTSLSSQYLSEADIPGFYDLDSYGDWVTQRIRTLLGASCKCGMGALIARVHGTFMNSTARPGFPRSRGAGALSLWPMGVC